MVQSSSSDKEQEEKRLDDELVETLKAIPHVNLVSPVLSVDVIARSGIYEGNFRVQGITPEAFEAMKIPLGKAPFPQKNAEKLEFFYGNMVLQSFYNARTGSYPYYEKGKCWILIFLSTLFSLFSTQALITVINMETAVRELPRRLLPKDLIGTCGLVEGGPENWSRYSYDVYCDIDLLKTELKRYLKIKPFPDSRLQKRVSPSRKYITVRYM